MKKRLLWFIVPALLILASWCYLLLLSGSTPTLTEAPPHAGQTAPAEPKETVLAGALRDGATPSTEERAAAAAIPATPPNSSDVVAKVDDIVITRGDLERFPGRRDDQTRLDELIARALLRLEFRQLGATLPETIIDDRVSTVVSENFHGDATAFANSLAAQGFTVEEFRKTEREKIEVQAMRQRILREAAADGSTQEREAAIRQWVAQRRTNTPITFPASQR